jgi:ABC-2 type transport system ATP-binding protein
MRSEDTLNATTVANTEPASVVSSRSTPRIPHSALNAPALLSFELVSKWYGHVLALNQVTLTLTGGITGLVGANGAGKSTLIRLATGQIRPTIGRVTVAGVDAADWRARRLIGYCPDHDAFYEDMTGRQFVREMARLFGFSAREVRTRTEAVLDRVAMSAAADRVVRGYSKGMRQRIKLAQALLHDPGLLILDEPLSGIDPVGRREMLDLFASLASAGKCLLISSHELEELEKLTDHVVIMGRGRVAAVGTLADIRARLDHLPSRVRIEVPDPYRVAVVLLETEGVQGVEVEPTGEAVVVRTRAVKPFLDRFPALVRQHNFDVRQFEPLDESLHDILGYLLGGSGKT